MNKLCNSFHVHAGCSCVRENGHDGLCWNKASNGATGTITRCEWYSRDGKFLTHHQYATFYPRNSAVHGRSKS